MDIIGLDKSNVGGANCSYYNHDTSVLCWKGEGGQENSLKRTISALKNNTLLCLKPKGCAFGVKPKKTKTNFSWM